MTSFESNTQKFGWVSLVNIVTFNDTGDTYSILLKFTEVTTQEVKKQARQICGDTIINFSDGPDAQLYIIVVVAGTEPAHIPRFHYYVRVEMSAKSIEGSLGDAFLKNLMLKKREFTWKNKTLALPKRTDPQ